MMLDTLDGEYQIFVLGLSVTQLGYMSMTPIILLLPTL